MTLRYGYDAGRAARDAGEQPRRRRAVRPRRKRPATRPRGGARRGRGRRARVGGAGAPRRGRLRGRAPDAGAGGRGVASRRLGTAARRHAEAPGRRRPRGGVSVGLARRVRDAYRPRRGAYPVRVRPRGRPRGGASRRRNRRASAHGRSWLPVPRCRLRRPALRPRRARRGVRRRGPRLGPRRRPRLPRDPWGGRVALRLGCPRSPRGGATPRRAGGHLRLRCPGPARAEDLRRGRDAVLLGRRRARARAAGGRGDDDLGLRAGLLRPLGGVAGGALRGGGPRRGRGPGGAHRRRGAPRVAGAHRPLRRRAPAGRGGRVPVAMARAVPRRRDGASLQPLPVLRPRARAVHQSGSHRPRRGPRPLRVRQRSPHADRSLRAGLLRGQPLQRAQRHHRRPQALAEAGAGPHPTRPRRLRRHRRGGAEPREAGPSRQADAARPARRRLPPALPPQPARQQLACILPLTRDEPLPAVLRGRSAHPRVAGPGGARRGAGHGDLRGSHGPRAVGRSPHRWPRLGSLPAGGLHRGGAARRGAARCAHRLRARAPRAGRAAAPGLPHRRGRAPIVRGGLRAPKGGSPRGARDRAVRARAGAGGRGGRRGDGGVPIAVDALGEGDREANPLTPPRPPETRPPSAPARRARFPRPSPPSAMPAPRPSPRG